jgi:small conductance mechanosensitive channel
MEADLFSPAWFEQLANAYLVPFGIKLVLAGLVFFVGRLVARVLVGLIRRLLAKAKIDESLSRFLCTVAYGFLLLVVVIAALEQLGVETTAAIAVIGAAGLAIGLALQGSLGNFASGVLIIMFKPFRIGDVVHLGGFIGKVQDIGILNTVLLTGDNREITLPNSKVTGDCIENISKMPTRRIDMVFGIGYGDDIKRAKEILERLLGEDERILTDPAPTIAVGELADSSVNLLCRPWVATEDYWAVLWSLTEKAKLAFDEAGISIPFPQRDVHLHQATG